MSLTPREWIASDAYDRRDLPPDLTGGREHICGATGPEGYACTRREEHTGRHAAGAFTYVAAVWEVES